MGDNFDAKYCNSSDKIGNATKERYEVICRQDGYREVFRDFFYYFNENDINDMNNTKDRKKYYNPHLNINDNISQQTRPSIKSINSASSINLGGTISSSIEYIGNTRNLNNMNNINNNNNYNNFNIYNNNSASTNNFNYNPNLQKSINEKINILNNIENKFSKIKILSSSGATSRPIIKHNRNSSTNNISNNNSTSNSSNVNNNLNNNVSSSLNSYYLHRKSGSTGNYDY